MSIAFAFNNKMMKYGTHVMGIVISPPDYNPLNLPPNTVRVRTSDGQPPSKGYNINIESFPQTSYDTATLVAGTSDVYDVYKAGTSFEYLLLAPTNIETMETTSNVVEVLGANTEGITDMRNMFRKCDLLSSVALFDTRSVTTMDSMFKSCRLLESVPLYDLSAATNINDIFNGCRTLTTVPQFDTHNVTSMYSAFRNCRALITLPLLDTSSVTTMEAMFYDCRNLTSLPLFDTSSVTNIDDMCYNCESLTAVPLFDTSSCTVNFNRVFCNCYKVAGGALALYQQVSTQANPPSSHERAFDNCGRNTASGFAELLQIPSSWGGMGA